MKWIQEALVFICPHGNFLLKSTFLELLDTYFVIVVKLIFFMFLLRNVLLLKVAIVVLLLLVVLIFIFLRSRFTQSRFKLLDNSGKAQLTMRTKK